MKTSRSARHFPALLTDLYELTMAYGYWKNGVHDKEAVFHLIFRKNPFGGGFSVACGLSDAIDFLNPLAFTDDEIAYLGTLTGGDGAPLFNPAFLKYLRALEWRCDLDAILEGTVVFPQEPLLRVRGPLLQAQIVETALLNIINFQTLIATKAARVCLAALDDSVVEFGLRRAHGTDGGLMASRAAYIGGCAATSNVLAGQVFGIPVRGTHAHSWVMAFDSEEESFRAYAAALPNDCIFLVDTYDTLAGVRRAITVGHTLREREHEMAGIRLDSGDLAYLSIEARRLLDEAGFPNAVIVASNDLDEHTVLSIKQQGAKIDVWGVGTKLVTGYDQPALGGVYKLSAVQAADGEWTHKVKLSEQLAKISIPGIQQVRRFRREEEFIGDMIFDLAEPVADERTIIDPFDATRHKVIPDDAESEDLLVPIFRRGELVYEQPPIAASRDRTQAQLRGFHPGMKRFLNPHIYPVGLSPSLHALRSRLIAEARGLRGDTPAPRNVHALILVDLQNDFLPGGALAVPEADVVVPIANALAARFPIVVATQDWHPAAHESFAANHPGRKPGDHIELHGLPQILWPVHCVQGTAGADFTPGLARGPIVKIFIKGTDPATDSYSGFFDNARRHSTGLAEWLRACGVTDVFIAGLATDYCVKATALDAVSEGFHTHLIADACHGVNLQPGDTARALDEMRRAGVEITDSAEFVAARKILKG